MKLTWRRIKPPALMAQEYPGTRCWQAGVHDGHLSVLVGREPVVTKDNDRVILWHLSISHRQNTSPFPPGRYPTWDEITEARYRFIPNEVVVAMFLPPREQYVNAHETTFHLWELDPGHKHVQVVK